MRHIISYIIFFILCGTLNAQNHFDKERWKHQMEQEEGLGGGVNALDDKSQKKQDTQKTNNTPISVQTNNKKRNNANNKLTVSTDNQFELYRSIVKQKGWYRGVGKPLTQNFASHLSCYFKLSKKDRQGHWQRIEALDGYNKPTTEHGMAIYLSNYSDTLIYDKVKSDFSKVCTWELIADATGKNVAQERAYDSDGNLIFTYSPVIVKAGNPVAGTTIVGGYSDEWGVKLPIRKDGGDYARVIWDENGYESSIECLDNYGIQQKNSAGAYMEKREYSKEGRVIRFYSCNESGARINDLCGNSGMQNTFDNNGNLTSATSFDENWNVCSVTDLSSDIQYIQEAYEYDEYGRMTKQTYQNGYGKDTINSIGVCQQIRKYNAHGQCLEADYLNMDGHLTNNDAASEAAKYVYDYDADGNCIKKEYFDASNHYLQSNTYLAKIIRKYDKSQLILEEKYLCDGDTLVRTGEWREKGKGYIKYRNYDNKYIMVDSLDNDGKVYVTAYFDFDGSINKNWNYFKYCINRCHLAKDIYVEDYSYHFWDDTLVKIDDFARKTCRYDSTECTLLMTYYDEQNRVLSCFEQKYEDNSFSNLIGVYSVNKNGHRVRTANSDGEMYYYKHLIKNSAGETIKTIAENEFGEYSYVTTDNSIYCYETSNQNTKRYYDINDGEITNFEADIATCKYGSKEKHVIKSKIFSLEILDTLGLAYQAGLRDGDIIPDMDWNLFILHSDEDKVIDVIRFDPKALQYSQKTIHLPKGTMSALGFTFYTCYVTDKEKTRIDKTISVDESGTEGFHEVVVGFTCNNNTKKNECFYLKGIKDPFIVLKAKNLNRGKHFTQAVKENDFEDDDLLETLNDKKQSTQFIYTKDGRNLDVININTSNKEQFNFFWCYLDDKDYESIINLGKKAQQKLTPNRNLTVKDIQDSLALIESISVSAINDQKRAAKLSGLDWVKSYYIYHYDSDSIGMKIDGILSTPNSNPLIISQSDSYPYYETLIDFLGNGKYDVLKMYNDSIVVLSGKMPRSYMGKLYANACGSSWSSHFSVDNAKKAIQYEYPAIYAELGNYFEHKRDTIMAMYYWQLGDTVKQGACLENMANVYRHHRDYTLAFRYMKKAAECGNQYAEYSLGTMYNYGSGTEKDEKQAFYWYNKANTNKHYSWYNEDLAECYEMGIGVEVDTIKALQYYIEGLKNPFYLGNIRHNLGRYICKPKWREYLLNEGLLNTAEILKCWICLDGEEVKNSHYSRYDENRWKSLIEKKVYRSVLKKGEALRIYYINRPNTEETQSRKEYDDILHSLDFGNELVSDKDGVKIYKYKYKITRTNRHTFSYIVVEENRISLIDGNFK